MDKHTDLLKCYFLSGKCRFVNRATLRHRFHVVTAHHCADLLKKDTFERDVTTNANMEPAKKCADGALEGLAVNGRFRRHLDGGCHHFSILKVHVNYMCAARRSICFKVLLLTCSWSAQEGVASLAGDFNNGAQRGMFGEPSLLQAAFSLAPVPWRSFGNSSLSGLEGTKCAECCGIVELSHINFAWLIKRMDPTALGVKKTDQSYHLEQWVHMQHVLR